MRSARFTFFLILLMAMQALVTGSFASVVTIDVGEKKGETESEVINVRVVKVQNDQVGMYIQSYSNDPQQILLKVNGLTEPSYDMYLNSSYVGERSIEQLQSGLDLTIPGFTADPDIIRCLRALQPKVKAENERIKKINQSEHKRVSYTLQQAVDWVSMGLRHEEISRSIDVILAPSGRILTKMVFITRLDEQKLAEAHTRSCWLLQKARDRMNGAIKDPELRNAAVDALTPIDFTASYTKASGKPRIEAKLVNNCDLSVSGNITLDIPKGWKTDAKSLAFNDIDSGETFEIAFDLIPPTSDATAPESVPIAANITITQDVYTAKLKLKTNAAITSPASD